MFRSRLPVQCQRIGSIYRNSILNESLNFAARYNCSIGGGAAPAPGSPFHLALPVHSMSEARQFYGNILGLEEELRDVSIEMYGFYWKKAIMTANSRRRSENKWQDYSLNGHQIVCHFVGESYRCLDYFNPVDGDEVPVPHFGLALTVTQFKELSVKLRNNGVHFIVEPHKRFVGQPGEQWTMFFKDPSGNNLEFKAMTNPNNLFTKYNVKE